MFNRILVLTTLMIEKEEELKKLNKLPYTSERVFEIELLHNSINNYKYTIIATCRLLVEEAKSK